MENPQHNKWEPNRHPQTDLAKKYKTSVAKLVKINNLKKASAIRIGFRLLLN